MPDATPPQELRDAAKRVRADASWPAEELHHALADWLEAAAEAWGNHVEWDQALAVARAYPGMQMPTLAVKRPAGSATTESTDRVVAFLDDVRKRWEAFGEGDATPVLLAAVERVLELAQRPSTGIPPVVIREVISQALLGEGGSGG